MWRIATSPRGRGGRARMEFLRQAGSFARPTLACALHDFRGHRGRLLDPKVIHTLHERTRLIDPRHLRSFIGAETWFVVPYANCFFLREDGFVSPSPRESA